MAKRRVLEKLIINEISGVDAPCQEGASVAILKRENPTMTDQQQTQPSQLESRIIEFNKVLAAVTEEAAKADVAAIEKSFAQTVSEIQKRDNCTAQAAMTKARFENKVGFAQYQAGDTDADFDALVAAEIQKGSPPSVAAQRVGLKYPAAAAAVIAKQGKTPFEKLVDAIMDQSRRDAFGCYGPSTQEGAGKIRCLPRGVSEFSAAGCPSALALRRARRSRSL
jgi:hypothetical protein